MTTAEQFECHPAGMNSIKESVLYCVGTAPDNYLAWGDIATWVTAGATLLLFLGGWLALRATKKQISEAREIANMQQRNLALSNFSDSFRELAALRLGLEDSELIRRIAMQAISKGEHWALSFSDLFNSRALTMAVEHMEQMLSAVERQHEEFIQQMKASPGDTGYIPLPSPNARYFQRHSHDGKTADFITLTSGIEEEHANIMNACYQLTGGHISESATIHMLIESKDRMRKLVPLGTRFITNMKPKTKP